MIKIKQLTEEEKLHLKNDGELSLFFIGVGSAFSKINNQTNLLIIKGNSHILIDCGTTCPKAMWNYGCPVINVENIFITHSHADHIGGMEEVALMSRYFTKKNPKLIIIEEYKKALWEYSLKGGIAFNEVTNGNVIELEDIFEIVNPKLIQKAPYYIWEINIEKDINLRIFKTKHIPDSEQDRNKCFFSYGVLINQKVIFTSDTRFDKELIFYLLEQYKDIKIIFHDCQLFTGGVHASYNELLTFPESIRKMTYLVHYGDNYKSTTPEKDCFLGFAQQGVYYIIE